MAWPAGDQWRGLMARQEPGGGRLADDKQQVPGESPIKLRSIPGAPTGRLQRRLSVLHEQVHTPAGLHAHDAPRRSLIENSMKTRAIAHELRLRGVEPGECKNCWGAS